MKNRMTETALTVGALLGLLCITAALGAMLFGMTPLVFRSGSMSPEITTGSLALGKDVPATDVAVGDIVSVDRSDGSRITHRVTAVDSIVGNSATLTLKGDANAEPDAEPYVVTEATRVVAHVPYAGYFVAWLGTPFAWATGVGLSLVLVAIAFKPADRSTGRHGKHAAVGSVAIVTVVASVVGLGFSRSDLTAAALQDTATANAAVTAATLTGPTSFTCTTTGFITTTASLSWVASNAGYGHRLTYTPQSGAAVVQDVPAGTSSTTPPASVLTLLSSMTVTLSSTYFNFVSTATLSRSIVVTSLANAVKISSCQTGGTATPASTPRSARIATTETPSTIAPSTSTTGSSTATSSTTTAMAPSATGSSTTAPTTTAPPTSTTTPPPTTTTTTPPPATTTPPPPPADAFIPAGSSKTSGSNTASIADDQLTVTDGTGTTVYQRPVTSTPRYGTGVVWSSTGALYVLTENAAPVRISPSSDGTWSSSTVDTSALPADISALV